MDQRQQVQAICDKITGATDIDWIELAEQSGTGLHPDQLRKMGAGIKLAMEAGVLELDIQPSCDEEQQKLRDLRNEMNIAYRADARSAAQRESVIEAARRMQPQRHSFEVRPLVAGDRTQVLCIADCHYGAEWCITGLNGEIVNAYNPDVFEERMRHLLAQVNHIAEREEIWDITLLLCGDSLDGMLRPSQQMKLRWGVVESCMRFAEYMAAWIAELSKRNKLRVYNVDGNHTEIRPLGSRRGEHENENMEKIITWYLAERLRENDRIEIDPVSHQMKKVEVEGFNILLSHDTDIKSMEAAAKQAMLLYSERIDFMVCGHKHREMEAISGYTDSGSALVLRVPSICGVDRYAQSLGYGGKPGALAMVLERGYGRRCVYPISLD